MRGDDRRRDMVMRALRLLAPSLREIAEETGLNYGTLRAYSVGHRVPDAERLARLCPIMRRRALELLELASEIDALAIARRMLERAPSATPETNP